MKHASKQLKRKRKINFVQIYDRKEGWAKTSG